MTAANLYLERVAGLVRQLGETQAQQIEEAADLVAEAWERGGAVLVATTSHGLHNELIARAGGPLGIALLQEEARDWALPLDAPPILYNDRDIASLPNVTPSDVVVIPTNCGTTKRVVGIALRVKESGAKCLALTQLPYENSTEVTPAHPTGKRLHEIADVTIDLGGEQGDAAVEVCGARVAPTSSVTATVAAWMMLARACEKLCERGKTPHVMRSVQLGGDTQERNLALYRRWHETGYPFDIQPTANQAREADRRDDIGILRADHESQVPRENGDTGCRSSGARQPERTRRQSPSPRSCEEDNHGEGR